MLLPSFIPSFLPFTTSFGIASRGGGCVWGLSNNTNQLPVLIIFDAFIHSFIH